MLIVDDLAFMRQMLKSILEGEGYRVTGEAPNGSLAVELYDQLKPDIVLLDIAMPVMNGFEAAERIRMLDPGARIIFCTALANQESVVKAVGLKAAGFVAKPFTPERVLEAVRNAIR